MTNTKPNHCWHVIGSGVVFRRMREILLLLIVFSRRDFSVPIVVHVGKKNLERRSNVDRNPVPYALGPFLVTHLKPLTNVVGGVLDWLCSHVPPYDRRFGLSNV